MDYSPPQDALIHYSRPIEEMANGFADAMGGLIKAYGLIRNPYLPTPAIPISAIAGPGCSQN